MSNDPWFRAGQRTGRKIEDEKLPPPQPGIIADAPDTFRGTAPVKIGAKVVTAHYFGSAPTVGEPVIVQQSGNDFLIIHQVPSTADIGGTAGAPTLPLQGGAGRPPISSLAFWGHSYTQSPGGGIGALFDFTRPWYPAAGGISQMSRWRIDRLIADAAGLPETRVRHFGVGGAILLADEHPVYPNAVMGWIQPFTRHHGWAWILQNTSRGGIARYGWPPQRDPAASAFAGPGVITHADYQFSPFMPILGPSALLAGTNDVGEWGDPTATVDGVPGMMLTAWTETNRSIIARLRCGGVIENDLLYDAVKQQYGVSYTGTWTQDVRTDCNSGSSLTGMISGTGTVVIHLAADWPGGILSVRFRGEATTGGTFTLPGAAAVSVAHRMPATFTSITRLTDVAGQTSTAYKTVPPWTPSYGTLVRRIPVAATGAAQTVTIAVNATAGPVWFDSCDLEQTGMAPAIAIGNICLPRRWMAAYSTSPRWAAYPDCCNAAGLPAGQFHQSGVAGSNTDGLARGTQKAEDGDTWTLAYNAALTTLAAEFAETAPDAQPMNAVVVADLYTACNGVLHPELYYPDVLHPNASGCAAIAAAFIRAFNVATAHPLTAAATGAAA